jgi:phosphoglycolate phosphatase
MLRLEPYLKNAKHVIWDWNGTLLSDLQHTIDTVNHFLKARQLPVLDRRSYKDVFGFPIRSYYENIGFDLNAESFEDLCREFVDLYMGGVFSCELHPEARDLLKQVKSAGKVQSILSASDQESLTRMIAHFGIGGFLDNVYGIADKFAASKVGRGRELIKNSGVAPTETILFGDTDHDLEVGHDLGVEVILLAHGHQSAEKLRKLHHTVIELN